MNNQNTKNEKRYFKKLEKVKEKNKHLLQTNNDIQKELEESVKKNKDLVVENDTIKKELNTIKEDVKLEIKRKEENYNLLIREKFESSQKELEKNILIQSKNALVKSTIITLIIVVISILITLFLSYTSITTVNEKNLNALQELLSQSNNEIQKTIASKLSNNNATTNQQNKEKSESTVKNKDRDLVLELMNKNLIQLHSKIGVELFYKTKLLTLIAPLKYEVYIDTFKEKKLDLHKPYIFDKEMLKLYKNWLHKLKQEKNKKRLVTKENKSYNNFKDTADTTNYKNLYIDNDKITYLELIDILNNRISLIRRQLLLNNYKE